MKCSRNKKNTLYSAILLAHIIRCVLPYFCAVVPHVTNAIMEWVERESKVSVNNGDKAEPEVCIIEVTVTILYHQNYDICRMWPDLFA